MIERILDGGNLTAEVVQIGDTVRRSCNENSEFVARLLDHLYGVGFTGAPRYLGVDKRGRDTFSFIVGTTIRHKADLDEKALMAGSRLLREMHDATAGHSLAQGRECVIHGDCAPVNTIFQNELPVAFIDWDFARPGERINDLARFSWKWCLDPDGRLPLPEQCRRLRQVRDTYGYYDGQELLTAIKACQRVSADFAQWRLTGEALTESWFTYLRRPPGGYSKAWYDHARERVLIIKRAEDHLRRYFKEFDRALI
jgi:thiamine kinase-like enzyme